jgi:hypothetical protein
MTRKDYELLAEVIATAHTVTNKSGSLGQTETVLIPKNHLIALMSQALEVENPRFNRELFLTACGVK